MSRRSLGKGLSEMGVDELLGVATSVLKPEPQSELKTLALEVLRPGRYQPRRHMDHDALEELANSIRAQGIIQPVVVRRLGDAYEIIAGERRWRAAKLAGLQEIPVVIRDLNDAAALAISLIENIQRENLNPIEEALALERLIEEFHMTHQALAEAVGKSRATVTNLLRLLKLNPDVRILLEKKQLDMGHARALLALEAEQQSEIANAIVARGLSVREAEHLIRKLQQVKPEQSLAQVLAPDDVSRLQQGLAHRLHAKVIIKQTEKGRGRLVIHYRSAEQLNEILEHIK